MQCVLETHIFIGITKEKLQEVTIWGGEIIVKKLIIAKQIKTRQLRQFLSNESKTHIVQIEKDPIFFLLGFNNLTSVNSILIRRNRILIITIPRLLLLLLEHIVMMMMTHGWHTHVAEHLRHHGGHVVISQVRSSGSEEMIGG